MAPKEFGNLPDGDGRHASREANGTLDPGRAMGEACPKMVAGDTSLVTNLATTMTHREAAGSAGEPHFQVDDGKEESGSMDERDAGDRPNDTGAAASDDQVEEVHPQITPAIQYTDLPSISARLMLVD